MRTKIKLTNTKELQKKLLSDSENMQLLAWEKGIGSCWKTPGFLDHPKFRTALNVKNGERVIAMLQLGYYDDIPAAKERKTSAQIVTRFGNE